MEDSRWLRLITIGLVLAAIGVGYFLFTSRFASKAPSEISKASPSLVPTLAASPSVLGQNARIAAPSAPVSAYDRILERNQSRGEIQSLPRTGFSAGLIGILTASSVVIGLGLTRFPK